MTREIVQLGSPSVSLGVETDSNIMTVQRLRQIRSAVPAARIVDFAGVLWEQRLIKSDAEVAYLRKAAEIADVGLARAVAAAAEGVSERVPAAAGYAAAIELGADNGRVLLIACGQLSEALHGRLADHVLAAGDILHLEFVPQVCGYSSRIMRPTVIGTPSSEQLRTVQRLVEIQDEQLAAMRPGVVAAEIDAIARDKIVEEGLRPEYRQLTGYTLGYHGQPRTTDHTRIFVPGAQWKLEPGMVFHMFLAARGMAMSETVLITDDGAERLTRSERTLFVR